VAIVCLLHSLLCLFAECRVGLVAAYATRLAPVMGAHGVASTFPAHVMRWNLSAATRRCLRLPFGSALCNPDRSRASRRAGYQAVEDSLRS